MADFEISDEPGTFIGEEDMLDQAHDQARDHASPHSDDMQDQSAIVVTDAPAIDRDHLIQQQQPQDGAQSTGTDVDGAGASGVEGPDSEALLQAMAEEVAPEEMEEDDLIFDETLTPLEKIFLFAKSEMVFHRVFVAKELPNLINDVDVNEAIEYVLPLLNGLGTDQGSWFGIGRGLSI
ncbi:hypothetical protein BC938DRAFT_475332 [Jimgerdemannia flammicorona]|uniref:Uncharacterized protein n=2 Tax=Jimgerdemannia flammicorona TaxID=994334 RepID=A0A433PWI0_9FUNG|nr:hypothetical protein BC938DRAFT_475332 [Jimgerdemannia flammicorona]